MNDDLRPVLFVRSLHRDLISEAEAGRDGKGKRFGPASSCPRSPVAIDKMTSRLAVRTCPCMQVTVNARNTLRWAECKGFESSRYSHRCESKTACCRDGKWEDVHCWRRNAMAIRHLADETDEPEQVYEH